jgi:hypothetical protein
MIIKPTEGQKVPDECASQETLEIINIRQEAANGKGSVRGIVGCD